MAQLLKPCRDEEAEAGACLQQQLDAACLPLAPAALERVLLPAPDTPLDTAMQHLPRPGIPRQARLVKSGAAVPVSKKADVANSAKSGPPSKRVSR